MKKDQTLQLTKDELQKELKKKSSALERLKKKTKISEEAHGREAQIEAALELSLERIRSKVMAMHSSVDILATTTTAFEELQKLGIHSIRCGIGLLSENSMEAQVYASAKDSNGLFQTLVGPVI